MAVAAAERVRFAMPGVCGPEGFAAEEFAVSDSATNPDSPIIFEAAALACGACAQIKKCIGQRQQIAESLHAQDVEFPVVGGEVVPRGDETRYLNLLPRKRLQYEPRAEFDLSGPLPDDPEIAIELLRQATRSGQWRLGGGTLAKAGAWALERLSGEPEFQLHRQQLDLTDNEVTTVLSRLGAQMVRHSSIASGYQYGHRSRPIEQQIDYPHFLRLAYLMVEDAVSIKGLQLSPDLAMHHSPEFLSRLLTVYDASKCISMQTVRWLVEHYRRDPITAIEHAIDRKHASTRSEDAPRAETFASEARREFIEAALASSKDEYPYLSRSVISRIVGGSSSAEAAGRKIAALKTERVRGLVEEFKDQVIPSALGNWLAYEGASRDKIVAYLDRVEVLTERVARAGGEVAPGHIRALAREPGSLGMSGEDIILRVEVSEFRRSVNWHITHEGKEVLVERWMLRKIVDMYPKEERLQVAKNINSLLEAGLLEVAFLSCALEAQSADEQEFVQQTVDIKTGKYLTFSADACAQLNGEQQHQLAEDNHIVWLLYGRQTAHAVDVIEPSAITASTSEQVAGPTRPSDEELVALKALAERVATRYGSPHAEDVAQEVLLKLLVNWDTLDERYKPSTWVFSTARNLTIDQLRKSQRSEPRAELPERQASRDSIQDATDGIFVQEAMAKLREQQLQIVKLRYYGGLEYSEIAARLGVSIGSIKSQLFKAHASMRRALGVKPGENGELGS